MIRLKAGTDSVDCRRQKALKLLRVGQWSTIGYITHRLGIDGEVVRRDLHSLQKEGLVELALALDMGEKIYQGTARPTAVRVTLAKLTEAGLKKRGVKACDSLTPLRILTKRSDRAGL